MSFLFQKVPEARAVREDLDEALRFHGLTRERMIAESFTWLESIYLESPETYRYLVTDPPIIANRISKWDFYFSTNMYTSTAELRKWTDWMALREFIQNSLDIEERLYGYENIAIKVFADEVGVHIVDRGPGLPLEAFRIGASDKKCYERGHFGEGLKVAGTHFVGRGVPVYVFNRNGQVFKMCLSPGTNLVLVVMGRASFPVAGTEVILVGARMAPDLLENTVFQEWMKKHPEAIIVSRAMSSMSDCPYPKPNFIIRTPEPLGILWVRDIFVNLIPILANNLPAIYCYNLWWVPLDPDRIHVYPSEFEKQAARAFTEVSIIDLLEHVVDKKAGRVIFGYFETDRVDWYWASEQIKKKVAEWVENNGFAITYEEGQIDWYNYMGVRTLFVPKPLPIRDLFCYAKTAETKVVEKGIERVKKANEKAFPEELLTLRELKHLAASKAILSYCHHVAFYKEPLPNIIVTLETEDASGIQVSNTIYILKDALYNLESAFSTTLHEYAHFYAKEKYGLGKDFSQSFQDALTDIYGFIASALRDKDVIACFRRCLKGAWKAVPVKLEEGELRWTHPLLDDIELYLRAMFGVEFHAWSEWGHLMRTIDENAPVVISISLTSKVVRPEDFRLDSASVCHIIPENVPPSRELYFREVAKIADRHAGLLAKGVVLIYDPWRDKYVEHVRVGL